MKKINNKGFVLVETLVTTVFVMAIFSILYNNFFPLMAEYEKRELYDDIDSKYGVYWVKRIIEDPSYQLDRSSINGSRGYTLFSCGAIANANLQSRCKRTASALNVSSHDGKYIVAITAYNTTAFKKTILDDNYTTDFDKNSVAGFQDYVNYLPKFTTISLNDAQYRVIAEFEHTYKDEDGIDQKYYSYSSIEVKKNENFK